MPHKLEPEIWKPIPEFFPSYEVSNLGRVRNSRTMLVLKPGIASTGYPMVMLGRGNSRTIHSLVMLAFVGPPPEGEEVRHIDGKRTNPRLDNLRYGTRTQNIFDAIINGSWMSDKRKAGLERTLSRPTLHADLKRALNIRWGKE